MRIDGIQNRGYSKQWKDNGTFWTLDHDWMTWRTARFSKQWDDNGTFWSLDNFENIENFKIMKEKKHGTFSWLNDMEDNEIFKTMKDIGTFWSLDRDNRTFWWLHHDGLEWITVILSVQRVTLKFLTRRESIKIKPYFFTISFISVTIPLTWPLSSAILSLYPDAPCGKF